MAAPKTAPTTVSMTAIAPHTYDAIARVPGEVYDIDPFYADTLVTLNFARRTDTMTGKKTPPPVAAAKPATPAPAPAAPVHGAEPHGLPTKPKL